MENQFTTTISLGSLKSVPQEVLDYTLDEALEILKHPSFSSVNKKEGNIVFIGSEEVQDISLKNLSNFIDGNIVLIVKTTSKEAEAPTILYWNNGISKIPNIQSPQEVF